MKKKIESLCMIQLPRTKINVDIACQLNYMSKIQLVVYYQRCVLIS